MGNVNVAVEKGPIDILMDEHKVVLKKLNELEGLLDVIRKEDGRIGSGGLIEEKVNNLILSIEADFKMHSLDKEEKALFPPFEEFIPKDEGPIGVMLAEHKDLVESIKKFKDNLAKSNTETYISIGNYIISLLTEHIYKEDNMLYPMAKMHFTDEQFKEIGIKMKEFNGEK